jgi:hypothetical protein
MTGLDSLAIAADVPGTLVLIHPATNQPIRDRDGREAHILLLGTDSAAGEQYRRDVMTRAIQRRNRQMTAEEVEANSVELLVALTVGWHLVSPDGEPIDYPFSPQNARALYSDRRFAWIKDQADAFVGDRAAVLCKTS